MLYPSILTTKMMNERKVYQEDSEVVVESVREALKGEVKAMGNGRMVFTELRTDRLVLRMFRKDDLQFVFDHFSDPDVSRFLYDHEPPATVKEGKDILKWCMDYRSKDHIRWCIELNEENENNHGPIGTCGFHCYNPKTGEAEIGYDLRKKSWNSGLMTEALGVMLKYGFEVFDLKRVIAYVASENLASCHLLEKLGFTRERTVIDQFEFRGMYYDHELYSFQCNESDNGK